MSNQLSPQIVERVIGFSEELRELSVQLSFQAEFFLSDRGEYSMFEESSKSLTACRRAMRESVDAGPARDDDEIYPLLRPCHYLLPQAFSKFDKTVHELLSLMDVLKNNAENSAQRLAYEYLAYIMEQHRETARFLMQTVAEELPEIEGLKALDTFKLESRTGL